MFWNNRSHVSVDSAQCCDLPNKWDLSQSEKLSAIKPPLVYDGARPQGLLWRMKSRFFDFILLLGQIAIVFELHPVLDSWKPKNGQLIKGQLISKYLYEIIVWTKIPTKNEGSIGFTSNKR